jgi:homoserine O-acetyltransferase
MGTTGPASKDAAGEPLALAFPVATGATWRPGPADRSSWHRDAVLRRRRLDGGGMQVLQWVASYPERVFCALPIATSAKHSAQNIAFHEVGRQAIMADPGAARRPHREGTRPRRASRWRAWPLISPICPSWPWYESSAAG